MTTPVESAKFDSTQPHVGRWQHIHMNEPIQYEKVKVKILLREPSEYNSWNLNRRMPQVGDVGYFIELLHTKGCPDHYVVEKTDPQTGENIWMSEFERNEIEPIK